MDICIWSGLWTKVYPPGVLLTNIFFLDTFFQLLWRTLYVGNVDDLDLLPSISTKRDTYKTGMCFGLRVQTRELRCKNPLLSLIDQFVSLFSRICCIYCRNAPHPRLFFLFRWWSLPRPTTNMKIVVVGKMVILPAWPSQPTRELLLVVGVPAVWLLPFCSLPPLCSSLGFYQCLITFGELPSIDLARKCLQVRGQSRIGQDFNQGEC